MWEDVATEQDIERLLRTFGRFHDSCLKELHLWTEYFVHAEDLAMRCPRHLDNRARVLFQRQRRNPSAVELLFDEVVGVHIVPHREGVDAIIFEATLALNDGVIYWSNHPAWTPERPHWDCCSWIGARRLRWRDASEWMGPAMRYGPGSPVEPGAQ